ncbi:hypothetical protein P4534_15925 [Peribacillus butanolivorans]|uniref:hypothetical protein n=1 Tax=Peribacillus butanolivorans TaxID=421767 RepID=UPI002E238FBC|nr:hypothetical protein [Peribacillus butanolivorans]
MIWMQMVKDLTLPNESKIFELMKRPPADPLIYLLKVQDKVGIDSLDYYKILMKKYEEGNNQQYKVVREYKYLLRDDRERKKTW